MKNKLSALVALLVASIAINTTVSAAPLTLNSPGVVGIYDGKLENASVATEIVAAQKLLDMFANMTDGGDSDSDGISLYMTSSTEYSGTLVGGTKSNTSASGWDYGFAKYDGKNAGYVLYYLGGALASNIVSEYPANLWTTKPEQYKISHLTVFNKSTKVPDGGTTAALIGVALIGMSFVARRRSAA